MTREEQILSEAKKHYYDSINCHNAFLHGVEWADEHPANVWHDASEEPTTEPTRVLATDEKGFIDVFSLEKGKFKLPNGCIPWSSIVFCFNLTKWAYISDLLPKGGEK